MKITKSQLRKLIKEQIDERCEKGYKTHEKRKTKKMFGKQYRNCVKAEAMEEEPDGEEYEGKIGKDAGRGRIQSTRITVRATSRDDAKRKALQHPTFKNGKYEYAMLAAPGSLEDYT